MSTNYAAMLMFLLGALVVCTSADCRIPSKPVKVDETSYNGTWYKHGHPENNLRGCNCNIYSFLDNHFLKDESCDDDRDPEYYNYVTDPKNKSLKKDASGRTVANKYVLDVAYDKHTIEYGCVFTHPVLSISTRDKAYQVPQADIDKALTENGIKQVKIAYSSCE